MKKLNPLRVLPWLLLISCEDQKPGPKKPEPSYSDILPGVPLSNTEEGARLIKLLESEFDKDAVQVQLFYGEHIMVVLSGFQELQVTDAVRDRVRRVVKETKVSPVSILFTTQRTDEPGDLGLIGRMRIPQEDD